MDTFDIQNVLYDTFTNDTELLSIFNNPSGDEQLNNIFRREELLLEELTTDKIPFVSFVFIDTLPTNNFLINRGYLEFNAYVSSRYEVIPIKRRIDTLVKQQFEYLGTSNERFVASGVQGIKCCRWVYRLPLRS